jgi:protein-tyrosine phosphatase
MQTVLFLCSGNYYRSRFAENLFNWLALQHGLDWRAESRGFRLHPANIGPISHHAASGLRLRGLPTPEPDRFPLVADANDIEAADLVIAVKEAEHRPMMLKRFPTWADRIEYWHIHDLDGAEPGVALVELEGQVRALVERLRAGRFL